jgi:hypothetical protein
MNSKSFINSDAFKITALSVIVAVITLRDADCTVAPNLDSSFRWVLNYLFSAHRADLANVIYPVGPLCFLKWPAPVGHHILLAALFQMAASAWFVFSYANLYRRFHPQQGYTAVVMVCTVLLMIVNLDYVLLGGVVIGMLSWKFGKNRLALYVSVVITVISCFTKASFFVMQCSVWLAFVIFLVAEKEFKEMGRLLVAGLVGYTLLGLVVFGSVGGLSHYAGNNLLIAFSYSDSISLFPYNNWKALCMCLALLAGAYVVFFRQAGGFVLGLLGLCFFVNWKYAMGREDFFHTITFVYLLVLTMALVIAVEAGKSSKGLVLLILSLCFYTFNMRYVKEDPQYFWFPGLVNFNDRVLHHSQFTNDVLAQSNEACKVNVLPEAWKQEIGNAPVDVFPYDLSIIMVNGLNYRHRPYIQCPPLNRKYEQGDIDFLRSGAAPQYIIWHQTFSGNLGLDGTNNDYLPNECPRLVQAILAGYESTPFCTDRFTLYRKRDRALTVKDEELGRTEAAFGSWVTVPPADTGRYVMAQLDIRPTFEYKLVGLLYKGMPVYIEYETVNGKTLNYTLSVTTAREGVFIGPLPENPAFSLLCIRRFRLLNEDKGFFNDRIGIKWIKTSLK